MLNDSFKTGSTVHLDEWVGPEIVGASGYLRPGKILEWMDVVGVIVASRYARAPVVTASIDGLNLVQPIGVGSRVTITAQVAFTSRKSIGVSVSMDHFEDNETRRRKNSVKGYMVFVALDPDKKPLAVEPFAPGSSTEQALFREGELRNQFRKAMSSGDASAERMVADFSRKEPGNSFAVREFLKSLPSRIKAPWDFIDPVGPRSRHYSYIHKIEPVFSGQLNFTGSLYGGTLVRWVETAAHLSAKAYCDGIEVSMSALQGLSFLRPVHPHVFLHIRALVVHYDSSCLTVLVEVQSEDPIKSECHETLRAFLTYQPVKKMGIPRLSLGTEAEINLYREVETRLRLQALVTEGS